ncbi:MAG: PD-(D/E)XK nuclease family protein [Muribaculaceae bacterium]|nr:PD-(D/E)XK nuclease family protein [Muribaculaceae bacterium]
MSPEAPPRSRFIHLWKVLYEVYDRLHSELGERGLTTSGGAYRLAVENLRDAIEEGEDSVRRLLPYRKIVMIGFNALSRSEQELFRLLKSESAPGNPTEPLTDFIWDLTGPILADRRNSAGRFVSINRRLFPEPEWIETYMKMCDSGTRLPRITAVSSPSKVMQVKIASQLIDDLHTRIGDEPFTGAEVALVLPDESLLLPMMYSLPKNVKNANLTMGYPLKLTAVTSFLALLRRMQMMRRDSQSKNYKGYAFEEVRDLLGHPYAHAIIGSRRIGAFISACERHHLSVVKDSDLSRLGEEGIRMLTPIPADATPGDVIRYLDDVLSMVERTFLYRRTRADALLNGHIELANVDAWRQALARLDDAIEEYGVKLSVPGTLTEAYRLLQGESVAFEGEPLKGLQIMGMLETRALDFRHLMIVSVNDRILPRRSHKRSFLPNVLRRGYGLPPVNYSESLFAYYFYRAMSRAEEVTLIYDNRVSGLTGGPSRYLMQLDNIYARDRGDKYPKVLHKDYSFALSSREAAGVSISKTPQVMEVLEKFRTPAADGERRRNLSASSLKHYIACHLKFYLSDIEGLRDDPEPSMGIDSITYGNMIHHLMEELMIPDPARRGKWLDPPIPITKELLEEVATDTDRIARMAHRYINKEYYHLEESELDRDLTPSALEAVNAAVKHIPDILRYDKKLAPFNLYGCEVKQNLEYDHDGRRINMTYAIDRIDDAECDGPGQIRIVDYKTGGSHIKAPSMDAVFDGSGLSDHYFQLQLYAILLNLHRMEEGKSPLSVKPVIYPVSSIGVRFVKADFYPKIGESYVEWHDAEDIEESFREHLDTMLSDIFDPSATFDGIYDADKCRFCAFKSLCRD